MSRLLLGFAAISAGMLIAFTAVGSDWSAKCPTVLSEKEFKVTEPNLKLLTPPELNSLPANFLCQHCVGGMVAHGVIFEDGSVGVVGWDGLSWTTEPLQHAAILADHIQAMRYEPPRVSGKPVCVAFDAAWSSNEPRSLRPLTSNP